MPVDHEQPRCPICGYDLHAQARLCSECGTAVVPRRIVCVRSRLLLGATACVGLCLGSLCSIWLIGRTIPTWFVGHPVLMSAVMWSVAAVLVTVAAAACILLTARFPAWAAACMLGHAVEVSYPSSERSVIWKRRSRSNGLALLVSTLVGLSFHYVATIYNAGAGWLLDWWEVTPLLASAIAGLVWLCWRAVVTPAEAADGGDLWRILRVTGPLLALQLLLACLGFWGLFW
ncbi:MAG: zinc ribbon domain-containing protein [Phycisphaerales bacterium]